MTVYLKITVTFDKTVSHYLNKFIEIPDSLASEKHLKNGQAGAVFENSDILKITYRGSIIELRKSEIRVLSVEEKGILDYC
jgi:hypothetical protein